MLRHPNVLQLLDMLPSPSLSCSNWRDVYLVTRLYDTNLHRVIYSGQPLSDEHVQYILWQAQSPPYLRHISAISPPYLTMSPHISRQAFRALRYLHAAGVVHRALTPTKGSV